jgi:4-hydroxy-tetrahydrodipicolinate synthase
MSETIFGRVLTAMVTPFAEDGSVNYAVAEKLADHLVSNGSDGLVVCGTTGESPTLTEDEKYQLFKVIKKAVGHKAKIIAGTGANSTAKAISSTKKASELAIDASLQVVPYYNKPPQEGLYQHFEAIAKACPDLPIMLYNIPGRTGRNLEPETIAKLAHNLENIVAVKEASGNLESICKINSFTPSSFALYSGEDFLTLPMMTLGSVGVVSVTSHLAGKEMQQMIQAFEQGNTQLATEIHLKLFPLFQVLFSTTNPIPVKAALKMQGWKVGGLRLPLNELPSKFKPQLETVLKELKLI